MNIVKGGFSIRTESHVVYEKLTLRGMIAKCEVDIFWRPHLSANRKIRVPFTLISEISVKNKITFSLNKKYFI